MLATWGASSGFNVASLFAAGEQGAWYDPSDNTTMFTTSAGTTQVTAVEQAVGLILDKSKGLVLGPELVTNGDFSNGSTGWTLGSWTVSGGFASVTTGGTAFYQNNVFTIGKWYRISLQVSNYAGGSGVGTYSGATASPPAVPAFISRSDNGTLEGYILATSTTLAIRSGIGTTSASVTNISVKELPGNHAYQTTDASRPILRSRYNLLTYSEQFENAAWDQKFGLLAFGSGSVVNATTAPDNTVTADLIVENTSNSQHVIGQNIVVLAANQTFSVYVKFAGRRRITLRFGSIGPADPATFDIVSGTIVTATAGTAAISDAGNGWYRCSLTNVAGSAGTRGFSLFLNTDSGTGAETYTGNGMSGVYVWGGQVNYPSVFPNDTYQRIAAATDYATGAAFPQYLAFDGTDDSLLTASVDFTGTDKMTVWSGVTKLSDAAAATLCELSASLSTGSGVFALNPGNYNPGTGPYWIYGARGAAALNSNQFAVTPANFASPITNVITGTSDIAGDLSVIRVNSVQQATATGDKGTGNFGNYPLYIGRRNNATQPFNGRIYSLIVRGAESNATQISATETWVANKCGLTL